MKTAKVSADVIAYRKALKAAKIDRDAVVACDRIVSGGWRIVTRDGITRDIGK